MADSISASHDIEMQAGKNGFNAKRVLYYWGEMYGEDFESGGKYQDLEQTYSVNILGFNYLDCAENHQGIVRSCV